MEETSTVEKVGQSSASDARAVDRWSGLMISQIPHLAELVLEAMLAENVLAEEVRALRDATKKEKSELSKRRKEDLLKVRMCPVSQTSATETGPDPSRDAQTGGRGGGCSPEEESRRAKERRRS
jgi:hypothetical protein